MTTTDPANPFVPPTARLEDHSQKASSSLRVEARVVPAGAAMGWIRTGWTMFQEAPGAWSGIVLLYFLIIVVVSTLPVIGMLNAVLSPVFAAGIILACEAQHRGSAPAVADLFAGFRKNTGNLMLIGVLYMVALVGVVILMAAGGLAAAIPFIAMGRNSPPVPAAIGVGMLFFLGAFVLILPLSLSVWWSPALVAVHDVSPLEAMKRSLLVCLRNWRALLVFGLLAGVMCLVAIIPLGLGLLVAGPVLAIGWWAGYREIFLE